MHQSISNAAPAASHTPGPWSVDGDGPTRPYTVAVTDSDQSRHCVVTFGAPSGGGPYWPSLSQSEKRANARLIAAAPDLLGALLHIQFANDLFEQPFGDYDPDSEWGAAFDKLKAIVLKVTGKPVSDDVFTRMCAYADARATAARQQGEVRDAE